MRAAGRWEVGSAFPLVPPAAAEPTGWSERLRLYGSGRQALRALLLHGRQRLGWTAVHLPTYYCPEIGSDIAGILPPLGYDDGPNGGGGPPPAGPTEAVVTVSYFGEPPTVTGRTGAALIVDATHDPAAPWLDGIRADYVVASLRKTLPLPDGGTVWSPAGHELPEPAPATDPHLVTAGRLLSAMCLKAAYLAGGQLDKRDYLELYAIGEQGLRAPTVSGISDFSRRSLRALCPAELRRTRIANARVLADGLAGTVGLTARAHSFGVIAEFDSPGLREAVRHGLTARDVYPAVLWALPATAAPHRLDFSRRMLHLHTDFRWDERDMAQVSSIVRTLCGTYRAGTGGTSATRVRPRPPGPVPTADARTPEGAA